MKLILLLVFNLILIGILIFLIVSNNLFETHEIEFVVSILGTILFLITTVIALISYLRVVSQDKAKFLRKSIFDYIDKFYSKEAKVLIQGASEAQENKYTEVELTKFIVIPKLVKSHIWREIEETKYFNEKDIVEANEEIAYTVINESIFSRQYIKYLEDYRRLLNITLDKLKVVTESGIYKEHKSQLIIDIIIQTFDDYLIYLFKKEEDSNIDYGQNIEFVHKYENDQMNGELRVLEMFNPQNIIDELPTLIDIKDALGAKYSFLLNELKKYRYVSTKRI